MWINLRFRLFLTLFFKTKFLAVYDFKFLVRKRPSYVSCFKKTAFWLPAYYFIFCYFLIPICFVFTNSHRQFRRLIPHDFFVQVAISQICRGVTGIRPTHQNFSICHINRQPFFACIIFCVKIREFNLFLSVVNSFECFRIVWREACSFKS